MQPLHFGEHLLKPRRVRHVARAEGIGRRCEAQQQLDRAAHAPRQRDEVVATLERGDDAPAAQFVGRRLDRRNERAVAVDAQPLAGDLLGEVRVEASRDEDQLRTVPPQCRHDDLLEGAPVRAVAGPMRHRNVDVVAAPRPTARLGGGARARIERVLVRRDVEHAGFGVERVLCAVAVVHVEIDDRHPLDAVPLARVRGRHGDVVQQAEAHRIRRGRVMPRRPHQAERRPSRAGHHGIDRRERTAHNAHGDVERAGRDERVRVRPATSLVGHAMQRGHVARVVHQRQLVVAGVARVDARQARQQP